MNDDMSGFINALGYIFGVLLIALMSVVGYTTGQTNYFLLAVLISICIILQLTCKTIVNRFRNRK